jgi:hypothetical protein
VVSLRGGASPLPGLLAVPAEEPCVAFAVLPMGVPPALLPRALDALRRVHDRLTAGGAKRYLSGWLFQPDAAAWAQHFGDKLVRWHEAKNSLDPAGVLRSALA